MNEFSIEGTGDRKYSSFAHKHFIAFDSHQLLSQGLALIPGRGDLGMTLHGSFVG